MTPLSIARYMASLFPEKTLQTIRLLDPGAGMGSLSCAFLDRLRTGGLSYKRVEVTAYEIDDTLRTYLEETLSSHATHLRVQPRIVAEDFIENGVRDCLSGQVSYTHAILNPPYKKIGSKSQYRLELRRIGIETVNVYSAFTALALALLAPGGVLVAIIPRSFCNGPYYRPFRKFVLERAAIRHMHLFGSRKQAFKDDGVLQENVIIMLERSGRQGDVEISTSTDDSFSDYVSNVHSFDRIVFPDDAERFIHIPTSLKLNYLELSPAIRYSLDDIGINVSTGPVVDFRMREHLRKMPEPGCVPLLYPTHFRGQKTEWPKKGIAKANSIQRNDATEKWLYPSGFYAVVRRFSSKEERRRVVASVVNPSLFPNSAMLGFENHLNVFHEGKHGLPENLARGLAVYLNTTAVDDQFRRFSGHTQVNATDLKLMRYPSRDVLISIGEWARAQGEISQAMVDEQLNTMSV